MGRASGSSWSSSNIGSEPIAYVLKAPIADPHADRFAFPACKTMYGGKQVAIGDTIYVFSSETHGGGGLIARGVATATKPTPRLQGVERQTPRVDIALRITARAVRRLGRAELKPFADWDDGRPESELNFKFYRQATDKLCAVSGPCAAFLDGFF